MCEYGYTFCLSACLFIRWWYILCVRLWMGDVRVWWYILSVCLFMSGQCGSTVYILSVCLPVHKWAVCEYGDIFCLSDFTHQWYVSTVTHFVCLPVYELVMCKYGDTFCLTVWKWVMHECSDTFCRSAWLSACLFASGWFYRWGRWLQPVTCFAHTSRGWYEMIVSRCYVQIAAT